MGMPVRMRGTSPLALVTVTRGATALLALRRTKRLSKVPLRAHLIETLQRLFELLDFRFVSLFFNVGRLQNIHHFFQFLQHVLKFQSDLAHFLNGFGYGAMPGRRRG